MKKRSLLTPAVVLIAAALSGGWLLQRGVEQEQNVYLQARMFQEVLDRVESQFVEEVEEGVLYEHAIQGVIDRLGDPNSSFLNVAETEEFDIRTEGEYGGVGLLISVREGRVTVMDPLPGGPGLRAGIRTGDRFHTIDGEDAQEWDSDRVKDVLRGRPGSTVDVTMLRPGIEEPIPFTLTREVVELLAVPFSTLLEDGIGYIPLRSFQASAVDEVDAAIGSVIDQGARSLVLDLRDNPGGLLDQGIGVADLFLDRGEPVLETKGRVAQQDETYRTSRESKFSDLPVVVLVNDLSASASEIVAGALQDLDRALVVGTTSFGKGSVQSIFPLSGGSKLRLTTARWFTPSGRSIDVGRDERASRVLDRDAALTWTGRFIQRPDTAGRPVFESEAGRPLYGGGGITPDLIVLPDTMTAAEERAARATMVGGVAFEEALFAYATRVVAQRGDIDPVFRVSAEMYNEFYQALLDSGLEIERAAFEEARRLVEYRLGSEIAGQVGGELGRFEHSWRRDLQLTAAVDALKDARSSEALLQAFARPSVSTGFVFPDSAAAPTSGS